MKKLVRQACQDVTYYAANNSVVFSFSQPPALNVVVLERSAAGAAVAAEAPAPPGFVSLSLLLLLLSLPLLGRLNSLLHVFCHRQPSLFSQPV